jgi:hypothetical protein
MIMKHWTPIALAALLAAGAATAQTSRESVRADLDAARRAGQTLQAGEAAWPEDGPRPAAAPASPATRAAVTEALAQARRDGELVAAGELGLTPAELRNEPALASGRTRQDVQAELARARLDGELIAGESSLTLREQYPFRYRAEAQRTLAARRLDGAN